MANYDAGKGIYNNKNNGYDNDKNEKLKSTKSIYVAVAFAIASQSVSRLLRRDLGKRPPMYKRPSRK